jgi:tetratricopeptide (TPR) repeat protein
MRIVTRATCISIVLLLAARVAAAQPQTRPEDERLYNEGQKAYDDKRYEDAIAAWEKSYAISKLPALLFNLGQANRLADHCAAAVAAYKKFLEKSPDADDAPTAEQFVRELEPCPEPAATGPSTTGPSTGPATTGPATTGPATTGPSTDHPSTSVTTRHVVDHGRGKRITGIVALGAGAALVATGAYFGNRAVTLADEVGTACSAGCEWADVQDKDAEGRRDAKLQYVFYGVGAAAIITGAVTYVLGTRDKTVIVEPHADRVSVAFRTTF